MTRLRSILIVTLAVVFTGVVADKSLAWSPFSKRRAATQKNWHGSYVHTAYGQPVALVVPPTARVQTNWGWGVGSSRVTRINHQFGRTWPGSFDGGTGFGHTPAWPSDTNQFGVYYVRAPW